MSDQPVQCWLIGLQLEQSSDVSCSAPVMVQVINWEGLWPGLWPDLVGNLQGVALNCR